MSNEIEKLQAVQAALQPAPPALQIRETVAGIKARVQMVQHVMRDVMKPGVHYGQIPGTPKPTLYKPGAELIALAFQFAPRYVVDDLSTGDSVRYRITCELYSRDMGAFIGSGQGEASSDEEKYRWRKAVCKEEWDETPEDRRRTKWAKGRGGSVYSVQQVRTEPADIANTVLKMAEKRAFVDAIRTTTGCSDMFAQDLEDLPAEVRDGMVEDGKPVVEHLGKESWQKLVMEAAALGYSEQEVIASAATAGHEGPLRRCLASSPSGSSARCGPCPRKDSRGMPARRPVTATRTRRRLPSRLKPQRTPQARLGPIATMRRTRSSSRRRTGTRKTLRQQTRRPRRSSTWSPCC